MKQPDLYKKTVNILVDAYFKNTLEHSICTACAIGNIIAANKGYELENTGEVSFGGRVMTTFDWITPMGRVGSMAPQWKDVFMTDETGQHTDPSRYRDGARCEIESTGYSWQNLAKIEYAFETAPKGKTKEDWMFNGLMAVIDVLDKIHENNDTEVTTVTKQRFNKCFS
jgi:hypothetical protein